MQNNLFGVFAEEISAIIKKCPRSWPPPIPPGVIRLNPPTPLIGTKNDLQPLVIESSHINTEDDFYIERKKGFYIGMGLKTVCYMTKC